MTERQATRLITGWLKDSLFMSPGTGGTPYRDKQGLQYDLRNTPFPT
jgi:hypothetical protein